MKVKSSALFGLMVVICSISGFSLLKRFTQEVDEWRPSNLYSSTNLTRRSTFSAVSSAPASYTEAVATISSGSESLFGHGGAVLYAPASTPTYSFSPLTSSPSGGLYTTSSAELRSFGGGGNGGGVSMSGGSVKSSGPSMASAGLSVSMPSTSMYAYNTNRNNSAASDVMSSVPGDIAMASTQAYAGIGNTTGGASRGISGRKDAIGMGGLLDDWVQGFIGNDDYWYTVNGINYFDYAKLRELYNAAIANGDLPEGITWEEFLSWFGDQSDRYAFPIPSGVWFMCFLALGYGLYIAYRRKQKVVNS
jgi:hypothetical protein